MRMWMIDPSLMCRQHLLGEHNELHMLAGCLRLGRSILGYARRGLVDATAVAVRHRELAAEMLRRGFQHHSPLDVVAPVPEEPGQVDPNRSLKELLSRCSRCRERYSLYSIGAPR